ncbi:MAG: metallophosphoesterase [Bacteroidota bacterium]|nr:metallophosphoesterase [Bacteroidota bacterium]
MQRPLLLTLAALTGAAAHGQSLPFVDNFNDGNYDGWEVIDDVEPQFGPSNWVVEFGELVQKSNIWSYGPVELETRYHLGTHVATGDKNWADYSFNAIVRSSDNDGVGLIFRYQDERNYYRILLMNDAAWSGLDSSGTPVNTPLQRLQKFVDGEPIILAENKVSQAYPSDYFALTADVRGDTLRAYLNGELILSARDSEYSSGRIGLLSYANTGAHYDSVAVTQTPQIYSEPEERQFMYQVREFRAPYIQNPTQSSIEVAWRTVEPSVGRVRYGMEKGSLDQEAAESEPVQKHHVRLDGLQVSTRYFYEVYSGSDRSANEENFKTAPRHDQKQFSFLVLGDSGVDTPTQWRVGEQMRASMNEREADFIVHVGDVHQGAGDYYDDIYFKPYREIIKNVNVFTSLGNHDVITDNGGVYLDDFYLPHNNADSTERYYSFRWANAYFIALDTNSDFTPGSAQHSFLMEALTDSLRRSAMWTFVYAHHPPYTEYWTNYYGDERVQNHLVPIYEEYDVDMVMNGHTHSYERGEKEHVHYLVSGGGGGALDDFFVDYDHITFSDMVHHFTRIDVNDDQLMVAAIDENGQQVDRFVINKYASLESEEGELPEAGGLDQNFPNPFADSTTIRYFVAQPERVTLEVYDLQGRQVTTLVDRQHAPGRYVVTFSATHLASGMYALRLTSGTTVYSRQISLVR